ncbi:MAG: hypothetical protein HRU19_09200 [Pseudobacteriovorax sp.]|nr:hypothetical protein [Pseudobacteriovorax sp.]
MPRDSLALRLNLKELTGERFGMNRYILHLICVVLITACSSTEEQSTDNDNAIENFENENSDFDDEFDQQQGFENQFTNQQFDNNQFVNQQSNNNQFDNQQFNDNQFSNQQFNNQQFNNQQFNNQQFAQDDQLIDQQFFQNDQGNFLEDEQDFAFDNQQSQQFDQFSQQSQQNLSLFQDQAQQPIQNNFDIGAEQITQESLAQQQIQEINIDGGESDVENPLPLTEEQEVVEVLPTKALLQWIGFEFNAAQRMVTIRIETKGEPQYEVFKEKNQSRQPEIVVRYFQTRLRDKLKWDIDASEFRSPLAYIRTRVLEDEGITDVVLTLREAASPKFFEKDGEIKLTFEIPSYYFGTANTAAVIEKKATELGETKIGLIVEAESNRPQFLDAAVSNDTGEFESTELRDVLEENQTIDEQGLPDSFNSSSLESIRRDYDLVESYGIAYVAQDNGQNQEFFENNEEIQINQQQFQNLNQNQGQFQNQQFQNQGQFDNQGQFQNQEFFENQQQNVQFLNNQQFQNDNLEFGNQNQQFQNQELFQNQQLQNQGQTQNIDQFQNQENFETDFVEQNLGDFQNQGFQENQLNLQSDVIGEQDLDSTQPQESSYKLIYMEFTDAPLSIVFKSFSEETGNNFIFPKAVGELTISIHFQGVPWDEALRAILETHSLGMVRVGKNIVRVDAIERLTNYLQALERAQQFETRRAPTKILVFRLNNAKAEEISDRINALLIRDKQVDPRIQASADIRTNSIVVEAPDNILAKTKNIIKRLDLKTPQVEIASRIVEIQKTNSNLFGISWLNNSLLNFDPGRGLGFGSLNFPNSVVSSFSVDPGLRGVQSVGNAQFKFGSINNFIDLDLLLRMEERKGTTNVLQSNRVLVLDGREALILAGNSKFFRPAAGGVAVVGPGGGGGGGGEQAPGLEEVKFNLSLKVKPQVTADGSVIMDLEIKSDTPSTPTGEVLADKNTRELSTQMVRESGDTGVIGGIYDTSRTETSIGIPLLSSIPILGALFRSTLMEESQTELLIMVTPTIVTDSEAESAQQQQFSRSQGLQPKEKG